MEELEIKCFGGSLTARLLDSGLASIVCIEESALAEKWLDKDDASQLHEWLGRYLENCDE